MAVTLSAATIPTPPRLSGNAAADNQAIVDWAFNLYRVVVIEQQLPTRLNQMASVPAMTTNISASPTQDEVQEIRDTLNALIAAAAPATE